MNDAAAPTSRPEPAPWTPLPKALLALTVALVVGGWAVFAMTYPGLPERIPGHFGLDGEVTRWDEKSTAWFLPVALTVCVAMTAALMFFPQVANVPARPKSPAGWQRLYRLSRNLLGWISVLGATLLVGGVLTQAAASGTGFMLVLVVATVAVCAYYTVRMLRAAKDEEAGPAGPVEGAEEAEQPA